MKRVTAFYGSNSGNEEIYLSTAAWLGRTLAQQNIELGYSGAKVALPGGFGTLDEVFEMLTWAQLGLHKKTILFFEELGVKNYIVNPIAFPTLLMN